MATLRQYFETDLTHVVRVQVTFPSNEGNIEGYWLVDFLGHMSYFACYVPQTGKSVEYFLSLLESLKYGSTSLTFGGKITLPSARQFPGELRIENQQQINLHARFFGDPAAISAVKLPMSRRVYIYSESNLTDSDVATLKTRASAFGHEVQLRSTAYASLRSAHEKPAAFISYDRRDREIAQKVAIGLGRLMCSVWYDQYSLAAGANLRDSIENGIKECKRCIVVLSRNFFSNNGWTKKEFDSIFMRETLEGRPLMVPIWLDVGKQEVYEYCPSLLGVNGLVWDEIGEDETCRRICRTIEDEDQKASNRNYLGQP